MRFHCLHFLREHMVLTSRSQRTTLTIRMRSVKFTLFSRVNINALCISGYVLNRSNSWKALFKMSTNKKFGQMTSKIFCWEYKLNVLLFKWIFEISQPPMVKTELKIALKDVWKVVVSRCHFFQCETTLCRILNPESWTKEWCPDIVV